MDDRLSRALRLALGAVDEIGAAVCLVGGLAVSARCEPRMTRDVDLAAAVESDEEAEQLVLALIARGWAATTSVEQDDVGRLATVRMLPPEQVVRGVVVDLLFASSGIEPEVVAGATPIRALPGLVVPVATIGHLIAMKLLARDDRRRPQDADDLRALLAVAGPQERAKARTAAALIEARGFARGRRLLETLDAMLAQ